MRLGYLDRYSPVTPPPQYAEHADYAELRRQRLEELAGIEEARRQEQEQGLREYQGRRVDTYA